MVVNAALITYTQDLFNELDLDHSGTISMDELFTGLKKQGYILSEQELEQLVRKIDMDHDGNISISEFIATLIDWDQLQKEQSWQVGVVDTWLIQTVVDTQCALRMGKRAI